MGSEKIFWSEISVSLRDRLRHRWLVEHETSAEEIAGLLAIVERDLSKAKVAGLSDGSWRRSRGLFQSQVHAT